MPPAVLDNEFLDGDIISGAWRQENPSLDSLTRDSQKYPSVYAKEIGNEIATYFLTREGEIEWQYFLMDYVK